jgi:hypothetical protein
MPRNRDDYRGAGPASECKSDNSRKNRFFLTVPGTSATILLQVLRNTYDQSTLVRFDQNLMEN